MQITGIRAKQGIRTHVLLVVAMALVITIVTCGCLLLIRHRLSAQVTDDLSQDLDHSVITFQNLQAERVSALERENSLLAELPTLKALMTSGDELTIQDGATEFWQLSGNDLFALAYPNGQIVAVYTKGAPVDATLRQGRCWQLRRNGISSMVRASMFVLCVRCTSAVTRPEPCSGMSLAVSRSSAPCGRSASPQASKQPS